MAIQPVSFKAKYKFPIAVDVSAMSWIGIFSNADGSSSSLGAFALSQDMNDGAARLVVFNAMLNTITNQYTDCSITTQTESWAVEGAFNVWTIDIEGIATDPGETGTLMFAPVYFLTVSGQDLIYATTFGAGQQIEPYANPEAGCSTCYNADVAPCEDLNLILAFTPGAEYIIEKIDFFGNRELLEKTADVNGVVLFESADFELGENYNRANPVRLHFYSGPETPHIFVIAGKSYSCLVLNFVPTARDVVPDPLIAIATTPA